MDPGPNHLSLPNLLHHSLISPQVTDSLGISVFPEPCAGQLTHPEAQSFWAECVYTGNLSSSESPTETLYLKPQKRSFRGSQIGNTCSGPLPQLGEYLKWTWTHLSLVALPPYLAEAKSAALTSSSHSHISSQPVCWLHIKSWKENPSPASCLSF